MDTQVNMSFGSHLTSYCQNIHQTLNDKLPQEGKRWEIAKRVAMAVIQAFLWIVAFMEPIPSFFLSLFGQRRATIRKDEIVEELPISRGSIFLEKKKNIGQEEERSSINDPLLIEPRPLLGYVRLPLGEAQFQDEFEDNIESARPSSHSVKSLATFDYVNLPKDLQRLILSFCSSKVKCQLLFVSHFTKNTLEFEVAMGKMEQALDWILTLPDLKKHLMGDDIGIQKLIDHLIKNSQKGRTIDFDNKSSPFMLSVFDLILNHGTDQQIEAFMITLTKRSGCGYSYDAFCFPKSINLFYEHLTRKRINRLVSSHNDWHLSVGVFAFIKKNNPEVRKDIARFRAWYYSSSLFLADAPFKDEIVETFPINNDSMFPEEEKKVEERQEEFEMAMGKIEEALDSILTFPDLEKHLMGDHIGIQKLINHLIENCQKKCGIDFESKKPAFILSVFNLIFNHGTDQQIQVFMRTLIKRNNHGDHSFPKSIHLFYEHLTQKRVNRFLYIPDGFIILSDVFGFISKNNPEVSKYNACLSACYYPSSRLFLGDAQFEDEG